MTHDPMLDVLTRYHGCRACGIVKDTGIAHSEYGKGPYYVLFSDLPALLAAVREDERRTLTGGERHREWWVAFGMGKVQGQRDERERIRTGVTGLSWWGDGLIESDVLAVIDGEASA